MKSKKEIIFFDGDGTLWYPKSTTNTKKPHWIYSDKNQNLLDTGYIDLLTLTPEVVSTLTELKRLGIYTIVVSTNPRPIKEASKDIENRINYFGLTNLIDEFYPSPDVPEGKGKIIEMILQKKSIQTSKALMVGDSYNYDYLPVKSIGVDTLFIKADYNADNINNYKIEPLIDTVQDVLKFI